MDPSLQRQFDRMVRQAQEQAQLELFWLFVIGVISTAVMLWALYWVIRYAVRDGMRDATAAQRPARQRGTPALDKPAAKLPDMRAD
ncbi:hypothetical protein ACA040_002377 [Xenophilus aerolatus]